MEPLRENLPMCRSWIRVSGHDRITRNKLVFDDIDPDWDKVYDLTFHHLA